MHAERVVIVRTGAMIAGRYRVDSPLGAGGMSSVFAGHDTMLDRPVALKLLRRAHATNRRSTERLLREAKVTARIVHAACVQVFDGGIDDELGAFLVMERLDGEDLGRLLTRRGPLSRTVALGLMEQICSIVHAVHEARVVHRDLKPGNVFVLRHAEGTVPSVKLLDFGIAQIDDEDQTHLTEPGDVLGTLIYMAPERWIEAGTPDVRTDVYALGVMLYEMLSGAPPFQSDTKAALRLAVLNDLPPRLDQVRPDVPVSLADAIARAMSKDRNERPADVPAFARALGLTSSFAVAGGEAPRSFGGTGRYRVERCISRGADTEIYAAYDVERSRPVAIKRLAAPRGEASLRLKREFRIAADVRHRNLVRLEELWEAQGELLLSMELVEGGPLLDYVRGSESRLRASLSELVQGLEALHAHELAHCDVKLENVLVEPSGRVVLLDCGLATRWCDAGARVRGTRAYLAPETLEGRVGPEADLFAVGVILHAALTGRPPRVSSSPFEPDRSFAPSSHDESPLGVLCRRLLSPDPTERPRSAEILEALRRDPHAASPVSADTRPGRETFVGRAEPLALLDEALEASANGGVSVVWVEGDSGIGKSALLERFRRRIEERPNAVVLFGRARHGDAVPFPALDEAIDDLASALGRLPASLADVVLPRRLARVARVFPSLAGATASARALPPTDAFEAPETTRRLAFDGLREVFARLADSRQVVLILDDLQWIDADSRALLIHLLDGDDAPRMLVLAALRPTEAGPEARKLEAALGAHVRRVVLGPLSHDESCALVRARWRAGGPPESIVAARLAEEARGIPVFLELLTSTASTGVSSPHGARLDDVVTSQMRALPDGARRALEVICLASRPLPVNAVLVAAGLRDAIELDSLRATPLARATPADGGWVLEPYHDRIRDAVRDALSPEAARDHHGRLAAALAADSARHPELLVEHLAASGARDEATALALGAARAASEQCAFDRAAVLIAIALDLGHFDDDARVALLRERAGALRLARRRRECGEALLSASAHARAGEAASLRREAGVHLLYSGDVQRGLEALEPALAEAGLHIPASFAETVALTQAALGAIAARGLVPAAPIVDASGAVARVDLCLLLAQGLAHTDLRVLPFACQGFLAALDLGDAGRLQRSAALFVINTVEYLPNPLAGPALELCRALTTPDATPYALASLDAALAENAHFESDFFGAEAAFERAEWTLLDSCPEATRELAMVRDLAVFVQYAQKGDFKSQLERTQRWQAEADAAQDIYHASMLRVAHAIVWIANDDPRRARAELDRARREWLGEASVLEVGAALYYDIIDRYEERDLAPALPAETRTSLLRSPAASTPFLGGYLGLQRAWTLLRAIAFGNAAPAAAATVREIVAGLRAGGLPIWAAVADALEANLDFLGGAHQRAVAALDRAETRFRRMGMSCLAACARRRRGEFGEGKLGARLRSEADAELTVLGVADVSRWTRAYWSMFDADAARARTNPGSNTDDVDTGTVTRTEGPVS